jgi:oligopeptide/dipeptide ABC transporter ATP-binding protein
MLLKVENLSVAFRMEGKTSVPVRGVSFSIENGDRVALVGESGCGKSLTALSIGSLVDRAQIKGSITGTDRIAYVFQNPIQSLNPVMRIGRQIEEASPRRRMSPKEIGDALESVGIARTSAKRYPCEFSGGQQQRIMIAMALAAEPELLIADEPTTALDVITQKEVLDLINEKAVERGMAVLLITHNLALVKRYSRFVNVMYAGKIVESGPVERVLSSPRHPYTKGLIAAVPDIKLPKDAPLKDIPGTVPAPWNWPEGCAFHPRCPYAKEECHLPSFTVCPFVEDL